MGTTQRCQVPALREGGEDTKHLLQCGHPDAQEVWEQSISKLKEWMLRNKTCPQMRDAICQQLLAWNQQSPFGNTPSFPYGLEFAIREQDDLGWNKFIESIMSKNWEEVQVNYLKLRKSNQNGRRWIAVLIVKAWNVAWDQWEHRNAIVHQQQQRRRIARTNEAIALQLELGPRSLLGEDRKLFQNTTWLQSASETLRARCLKSVQAAKKTVTLEWSMVYNRNTSSWQRGWADFFNKGRGGESHGCAVDIATLFQVRRLKSLYEQSTGTSLDSP